jgi:hypothetical protein
VPTAIEELGVVLVEEPAEPTTVEEPAEVEEPANSLKSQEKCSKLINKISKSQYHNDN